MSPTRKSPAPSNQKSIKKAELVIVANRLPVDRVVNDDGSVDWRRSPGGLVTAIEPVMRQNDGAWIGWSGGTDSDLEPFVDDGLSLVPVPLTGRRSRSSTRASPTPPCGRCTTTSSPSRCSTASGGTPTCG